jgi:aldehyde dehydrogenase (NAD+)
VTGAGGTVGDAILEHPSLKAISFTGSCAVGDRLYDKATRRRLRVQLEMGGKNPTIVLADANLDFAAATLVNAAFFSTGQKCTACSRAIVERSVYEPLVEKLIARTRALKIGNGAEAGSTSARRSMHHSSTLISSTSGSRSVRARNCCAAAPG